VSEKICQKYKPSLFLTFGEYGEYQGARHATIMTHVPRMAILHPMHHNADCSKFIIWKNTNESFFYPHCQRWGTVKDIPIIAKKVEECWSDVVFRLFAAGGSHIFSPQKKDDPTYIFKKLKLDPHKKSIIVYTSSYDERYVKDVVMKVWGEGPSIMDAFPDQITWLKMLRDYVKNRDDIQIVVRIHPREGVRQYGFDSQHLQKLKIEFPGESDNFIIVWPDDSMSSYDLMELADICLVPWSLMGQEAARLGIPVLSCTGNMFYSDDDFIQVATNPEEYRMKLDAIIKMQYSWQHLVKAIRFYHWRTFIPSLDLSETVPSDFSDDTVWPDAPASKIDVINDILFGRQDLIKYNIEQWQKPLPADAEIRESEAVRQGIRYFLDKIFYPPIAPNRKNIFLSRAYKKISRILFNFFAIKLPVPGSTKDSFIDYQLDIIDDISRSEESLKKTEQNINLRILIVDQLDVVLINRGKLLRRMSPMLVRLAGLYDSSLK
jgi:hypothetical protein